MKRIITLDIMRGIAIVIMVSGHFFENLSPPEPSDYFYLIIHCTFELLAAPIFTLLVGVNLYLSIHKQLQNKLPQRTIITMSLKRGAIIFVIGLIFALSVYGLNRLFDWDVLTFIGFSIIILSFIYKLKPSHLILLGIAIILVSPWLREWVDFNQSWNKGLTEYTAPVTFIEVWKGFWICGFFPIFPWLAYPIFGVALAKTFIVREKPSNIYQLLSLGLLLTFTGLTFMAFSKYLNIRGTVLHHISDWTLAYSKYPATTTFILISLGLTLLLFYFLYFHVEQNVAVNDLKQKKWVQFLSRYSAFSFTVYVTHHCFHIWPLRIIGHMLKRDEEFYFGYILTFYPAFCLGIIYVFLFHYLIIFWKKNNGKYGLEWFIHKFIK